MHEAAYKHYVQKIIYIFERLSLYVCFCTHPDVCVCVCVCLQLAGSGMASRQEDHFQSATDLTLICSVLLAAAGLRPQREQSGPASADTNYNVWL